MRRSRKPTSFWRRVVAASAVVVVLCTAVAGVLFARDRVLLTGVLAKVDAHSAAPSKACAHPCRGGRMLLL